MPQLGIWELLIILVIIIIVFGVGKLPQIGGALGKGIAEFRHATHQGEEEAESEQASLPEEGTSQPS
jgi:sec-independent protein translocase protein TatA